MSTNWRITSFNGVLLAAYFIPTWAVIAYRIVTSPVRGLYERPSVSIALYASDHLQLASMTTVRFAWLLALGRLTVVAFFVLFLYFAARAAIRKTSGGDEALGIALGIGSVISFASMIMASQVGEVEALRLHASELLVMLGTAVVMTFDRPVPAQPVAASPDLSVQQTLSVQQAQLANNG
jgi:hypothetical protein